MRPNLGTVEQSATLVVNELTAALEAEGRQVFKFGFGQSPFPVPEVVVDELRSHSHEKDYLPLRGLPALRRAAAGQLRRDYGIEATDEDVLIGPGSKELMFLLQLAMDADLILPAPSWVSYAPQARLLQRPIHLLPTQPEDGWCVDPDALDAVCRVDPDRNRLLILTDPSNPTGTVHSMSRQREIADVARRYSVICLSDEIYAGVTFTGRHRSMAVEYPEGTIVSTGLSKWCGAGGWRLGAFLFPENLRWMLERVAVLASETFTAVSAPIQYAAVRAYEGGDPIDEYLFQVRRILCGLAERVVGRVRESGVNVVEPVGGFYVFPDFASKAPSLLERGITTSQELCNRLLTDTGVALLPGRHFNMPMDSLTARLAFVDIDGGDALAAATGEPKAEPLPDRFFEQHAGRTLAGVDRLCDWLDP